MTKKEIWEAINHENVPKDRRCIKSKCNFKIKRNGVFHARLVACGNSQVPGVDFNKSLAPVINDVSLRILLVAKLVWDMKSTIIDIETAFLYGNLDEEVYMDVTSGLIVDTNKKLMLQKTIYGLVQSARKFYEKLIEVLKVIGFVGSKSDPCLWTKRDLKVENILIIGIYVDDCLIIGKEISISEFIHDLKGYELKSKIEKNLVDYLTCQIVESENTNKIVMVQPHLVNLLIQKFEPEVI
jgi:Reverse transcriptase (RNA-dependent DNA polymerase)